MTVLAFLHKIPFPTIRTHGPVLDDSHSMTNSFGTRLLTALICASALSTPLHIQAQEVGPGEDVLIMRRSIAKPDKALNGASWITGQWSQQQACGEYTSTRTVTCTKKGDSVPDSECTGERPAATQTQVDYDGCGPSAWHVGEYSDPAPSCGDVTATRTVECRAGDQKVPAARCSGSKPANRNTYLDTRSCSTLWVPSGWSGWSDECSSSATRTRTAVCKTDPYAVEVADGRCSEPKPTISEEMAVYSACPFIWKKGEWSDWARTCGSATRTRTVACYGTNASGEIVEVDASSCDAAEKPAVTETLTEPCVVVLNGSFEDGGGSLGDWTTTGSPYMQATSPQFAGAWSAALRANDSISQNVATRLTPGKTYQLSYHHFVSSSTPRTTIQVSVGPVNHSFTRYSSDREWKQMTQTFVAGSSTVLRISVTEGLGFIEDVRIKEAN